MVEQLKFSQLGQEDFKVGTSTFDVRLADGRIVALSEVNAVDLVNQVLSGSNPFDDIITKGPWVDVRAFDADPSASAATNTTAFTNADAEGKTLLVPSGTFALNDITLSSSIIFMEGGILAPESGQTITIKSPIRASFTQIFGGAGSITFGSGSVDKVFAEWWGIDGTDDDIEIQAANDALSTAGGKIQLLLRKYSTTSDITIGNGRTLQGLSFNKTTSQIDASTDVVNVIKNENWDSAGDNSQITIRDLSITTTYGDADRAIALQGFWFELSNIKVDGFNATTGAVLLRDGQYATIHNLVGLGHASAGVAGAGHGLVLDNFKEVFGTFDMEGYDFGLQLKAGSDSNNLTGRLELDATHGAVLTDVDDNVLHLSYNNCASRWLFITGTSLNNRAFVSRGSDTNVPGTPVLIDTNASGNLVFSDETYSLNNNDNTVYPDYLSINKLRIDTDGDQINGFNWNATASVADGGTITHGAGTTPTAVIATGSVASEFVSVTAIGATTFTVAIKKDDGTAGTSQTIYWIALN